MQNPNECSHARTWSWACGHGPGPALDMVLGLFGHGPGPARTWSWACSDMVLGLLGHGPGPATNEAPT